MTRPISLRRAMLFFGPIAALLLVLVGILAIKLPGKAHAAGGVTLYVGQTQGNNTSCQSPGYTSVQLAVDVANNGDTVYLCGTTPYAEQVIITKAITLTGDTGASIVAPNPFPATPLSSLPPQFTTDNLFVPQAIVFIWGSGANVTIKNLTISGVMPGNGTCADNEFGVLIIDGGTATLKGDQVLNIQDSNPGLYGCQFGVGIQDGREYWPKADFSSDVVENFTGNATIKNTTVSGYQKNGITIDGPGTTAYVSKNTVTGAGRSSALSSAIAQNGIEVGRGASAQVLNNTVSGNSYTGSAPASSGGVLVFGGACIDGLSTTPLTTGTKVSFNTLQDNDVGVYMANLIYDTNNYCALPTTPTSILAYGNHITSSAASNVGGTNLFNSPGGYQAGVSDEGYGDKIQTNSICGVGYTPVNNPPPYLSHIDVIATNPNVKGNTTCTSNQDVTGSAATSVTSQVNLHSSASPVK